jgi:phenol/toluene 2-monooxygenase (NADH) P4/A4
MPVHALTPDYMGDRKDAEANFHGNIIVYCHWAKHLLLACPIAVPLPAAMPFGKLVEEVLPNAYRGHPDFARIDWSTVRWTLDRRPFTPAMDKSLAENGVGHKSAILFTTPGLNGLDGTGS